MSTDDRTLPCDSLTMLSGTPECMRGLQIDAHQCATCAEYAVETYVRTRCEVWTRVMGYHRPTSQFNKGKQQEHRDRLVFRESPAALESQA
jgi:hypothetical protein